jgi:LmbE family N-acetylglucosaminyl deacetylase
MKTIRLHSIKNWGWMFLILATLVGIVVGVRELAIREPGPALSNLQTFSLAGHQRLLILAPHCDDETLGAAGLILAAQRSDIEARVVIATNGDGYLFATMEEFKRLYPRPQDFIRMGNLRQQESLAALAVLGLRPAQVSFLSYPDRGSPSLWYDNWKANNPYRSPYSEDTHSPYPITYNPKSVYAGENFLADIISILDDYRPDLVIYPNPEDVHPDHWGLNVFTRLALTLIANRDSSFHPTEYTYLVHRPDFPEVRGLRPTETLVPPSALYALFPNWYQWDLTTKDIALKGQAVQEYRSQLPLLRGLMESFVRVNELFSSVSNADLKTATQGNPLDPGSWRDNSGTAIAPVQLDPTLDFFVRDAIPASDLTTFYAARGWDGQLWMCGQLRASTEESLTYLLRLKALTTDGIVSYQAHTGEAQTGWDQAQVSGRYFCTQVSMTSLGNPWAVYAAVESQGLEKIAHDQTGWQMIMIKP